MRKLLFAVAVLVILLSLPLLAMRSERTLLFLAEWSVDTFTDLRLVLRDPVLRPLQSVVSASEIHLYPKADDGPPFVSVLGFSADLDVMDLYTGDLDDSSLRARAVIIYVSDRDQTSDPSPQLWLKYLGWLPRDLRIGTAHLVTQSDKVFIFPLEHIIGQRTQHDSFRLTAAAQYEGEPLGLELDLLAVKSGWRYNGLDLTVDITAPESGSEIGLDGELRGTVEEFDYKFKLDAHYRDVAAFMRGFAAMPLLRGELQVRAEMQGDFSRFSLHDATFTLDNTPQYYLQANGSLEYAFSGENSLQLKAIGQLDSFARLLEWLSVDLTPLGAATAEASISGTLQRPVIEKLLMHSENASGLKVDLSGRPRQYGLPATQSDIAVEMSGPALAVLSHWTGPLPVEPGPFTARGHLNYNGETLSLHQIDIHTGAPGEVELALTGDIGTIAALPDKGLSGLRDVQLEARLQSPDSGLLAAFVKHPVPQGFAVDAGVAITGSGDALSITGGSIQATTGDIALALQPDAGTLRLQGENPLSGLRGKLDARLADTAALSRFFDTAVPALGGATASASLVQDGERFGLSKIAVDIGGRDAVLHASGAIDDLAGMQGVEIATRFSGVKFADVFGDSLPALKRDDIPGLYEGSFTVSRAGTPWNIRELHVVSADSNRSLWLDTRGELLDVTDRLNINLATRFKAYDASFMKALTGLEVTPGEGTISIASEPGKSRLTADAKVGNTQLSARADLRFDHGDLQQLALELSSPRVYLRDLGLQTEEEENETYKPAERLGDLNIGEALDKRLQNAPKVPTDIRVDFDSIVGENTNIEGFHLQLTGADKRYTLRRLSVGYDQSVAELRGIIDLNTFPPYASFAVEALALPMHTLTRDLGIDYDISGLANVRGGLTAQGSTGNELLQHLDGNLAVALEDAIIEGAAYDVLATDFLAWIYSGAALEKSTHVDCTMAKFQLAQGVATSDSLYIETTKMVATGTATLDLGREKMDVEITPLSKSRSLQVPSSVHLKGDFGKPRVIVSPIAAAFDTTANLLTVVPRMVLKVFGAEKKEQKQKRPCVTED